jgi:hypothetical protein
LSARAPPTLRRLFVQECLLHRVQRSLTGQSLNRADGSTVDGGQHSKARANGNAIQMNVASATNPYATAIFGAGQAQFIAQDPEQRAIWLVSYLVNASVNRYLHQFSPSSSLNHPKNHGYAHAHKCPQDHTCKRAKNQTRTDTHN